MRPQILLLTTALAVVPVAGSPAQELTELVAVRGSKSWADRPAISPDGHLLAAGRRDNRGGELKLWDATTGKEIAVLAGYAGQHSDLAFSPDGKRLAAAANDGVQVWDVRSHERLAAFKGPGASRVVFSPDGRRLAAAGNMQVKVWDVDSGKELASFQVRNYLLGEPPGVAFSRDLTTAAVRDYQEIDLWDLGTGKVRATLSEHRGEVHCLVYSADGKTLVASSTRYEGNNFRWKGDVKLWDVAGAKERVALKGPFGRVLDAALSPDGKTLALLDSPELRANAELKLVDVATGRQYIIRPVPACPFRSLAFTAAGKLLVTGTADEALTLWEVSMPMPTPAGSPGQ
jgi:WD40 repeat protein